MTTVQSTYPLSRWQRIGRSVSRRWQRLVEPHPSIEDRGTRRQVQLQTAFILVLIASFVAGIIATAQVDAQRIRVETIAQVVCTIVLIVAYALSRTRHYEWGIVLLVTALSLTAFAIVLSNPASANTIFYAFIPLTFVIGGFLLRTSYAIVLVAVDTLIIFAMPLLRPGQITFRDIGAEGGITLALGVLLIVFGVARNLTERDRLQVLNQANAELLDLRDTLEERVSERTAQLQASAAVGQAAAATLDAEQLLQQVVSLITDQFGFYYAAVFTMNESGTAAVLREATGEAGRILKERSHQLEVNERSMVGYAITQRKARIALDVGADPVRFANPLLPDTRSEIALPLIAGNRVLGALDVQSTQPAAFDEASAVVLQSMADQIAVALSNAVQFRQTETQATQQASLNQFSRALFSASGAEDLYKVLATDLSRIVPHDYINVAFMQSGSVTLRTYLIRAEADPVLLEGPLWSLAHTLSGRACATRLPVSSANLAQDTALEDAAQLSHAGYASAVSLPLIVGERVLGTLNLASRTPSAFSQYSAAQLDQFAAQIAVALENQRLVEAQQKSLQNMEALTRQLTSKNWAARSRPSAETVRYARSGLEAQRPASTPEIETAIKRGEPIARTEPTGADHQSAYAAALAVPIVLRGEVLGGLQVSEAEQARTWTEDDLSFMQAVADQVALALDNARLLEETQRRAERERLVGEISSRMFAANDLETIVQIAGEELGRVLHVKQTTVKVRSELAAPAAQPGMSQSPNQPA